MADGALPFRLLVITDEEAANKAGRGVIDTLAAALLPRAAGVAVLVRAKQRSQDHVAACCSALLPIAQRAGALLLVHTHVELVAALGLSGAHVDAHTDVTAARALLPQRALLGASRHQGDSLDHSATAALDYLTLSPIFSPASKPRDTRPALGLAALAWPSAKPVVALGGISAERAAACFLAGAAAVAVIDAVMAAHDPRRALVGLLASAAP